MWWDGVQETRRLLPSNPKDSTLPPATGSVSLNPPETFWGGVLLIPMSTMKGPHSQPGEERSTFVASNELRRASSPADGSAARRAPHTPGHTKPDASGGSLTNLSAQLSYRSCVHRQVPLRSSSSVVFLNKSLSICLAEPQGDGAARPASYTSTLSVRLRPCADSKPAKINGVRRSPRAPASMGCDKHRGPGHGGAGAARNRRGGEAEQTVRINGYHNKAEGSDLLSCRGPGSSNAAAGGRKGNADEEALPSPSNFRHTQPTFNIGPVDSWSKQTVTDITEEHGCQTNAQKVSSLKKTCYYHSRLKPDSAEGTSPRTLSLKEALELFRPDFISRSQGRVRRLEQMSRRRRALQDSNLDLVEQGLGEDGGRQRRRCTTPDPLSDNLFRPRERSISGREMQLRSRRIYNKLPEVTKRKEEEKRRAVSQTNRLRAEVFKKRLLEQVLQR